MKRFLGLLVGGVLMAGLCGCGEPTFDTSNETAFQSSISEMTQNMSLLQKEKFLGAIEIVKSIYTDEHPQATPDEVRAQFKDWTAAELYQRARLEVQK